LLPTGGCCPRLPESPHSQAATPLLLYLRLSWALERVPISQHLTDGPRPLWNTSRSGLPLNLSEASFQQ